ncbi:MAG TPA: choice-of-anchor Q domain-containing protein [Armatimonadota bacterium]|jgi:hypothetical protein
MKRVSFPLALSLLGIAFSAQARVVYVDQNAVGPAHDGSYWPTAYLTVTAGLSAAGTANEVWVAKGTYTENVSPGAGAALYGGFAGTETARAQRDWRANPTALDAGGNTGDVMSCAVQGVVVDGFTLRNGRYGVYVSGGAVRLANCAMTGNGEAVDVRSGTVTLANTAIVGNAEAVDIWGGVGTLAADAITGNNGNGVFVYGGAVTLANVVIAGNGNDGVDVYQGTAALVNTLVATNHRDGVGVYNGFGGLGGKATLVNSIVAFNGGNGVFKDTQGSIPAISHNDVFGNAGGDYSGLTPPTNTNNLSQDPLLTDRANGNYRLQAGSPCIDAGDDAIVTAGETDLDGKPRISGLHVDIGPYEYDLSRAPFVAADVKRALAIAAGFSAPAPTDLPRLNVESGGAGVDLSDGVSLARKVTGQEANP